MDLPKKTEDRSKLVRTLGLCSECVDQAVSAWVYIPNSNLVAFRHSVNYHHIDVSSHHPGCVSVRVFGCTFESRTKTILPNSTINSGGSKVKSGCSLLLLL